jgi:hypothetical protein
MNTTEVRQVRLGQHHALIPRDAIYIPKWEGEPSVDMVIYKGRIILGTTNRLTLVGIPFVIWLQAENALPMHTFAEALQWCQRNPV